MPPAPPIAERGPGPRTVNHRHDLASDVELVARVVAGDLCAFEPLMRRHNQLLYRVARGILLDDGDAEDAVQQTYVMAYANLSKFSGRARLSTWLTRIAIHEALARKRKRKREPLPSDPASAWQTGRSELRTPEDELLARELRSLLESRIDALPTFQRLVFVCRDVQGLSSSETADALDTTEGNVRVTLHRVRRELRASLGPRLGQLGPEAFAFAGERCDRIVRAVLRRIGGDAEARSP